ncbi:MAG TPA: protein kinase [Polyangiaceae bacterium]|jgi:serine/threonine-protein kinase|nr:protein kinase [Polyangiaceae bacterium]
MDLAPPSAGTAHPPENSELADPHAEDASEPRPDRRIGQLVDGKYFILRRLACGGMGSVYEARHSVVGRHFALKFLHEQYAQRSSMVQRFLREAQAAGSIASEHVIGVLDYGSADGAPYLVMELVRGQDLRELLIEQQRLEEQRAVRIVLDACRGLALAHDRGLVHRDLKPANICVTQRADGREMAKVIDFGVAKLRDGVDLSEEGTLIGTVGYMAPEQLTDHRQIDARADIFALGVILYQALAGRPPHQCSRSELLYRIVSVDPPPLSELCPELSPGLSDVVRRALARNKDERYPSARELARALEPYAGESLSLRPLPEAPALPRPRRGDLGTAETELESAPTWVALGQPERGNLRADRNCERQSSPDATGGLAEEFCRQPVGFVTAPPAPREPNTSQRALALSVGALALSVVAMTTMFIFVYSHGERALEVPPGQRSAATLATAQPPPEVARAALPSAPAYLRPAPVVPDPAGRSASSEQAVARAPQCFEPGTSPLAPASVIESGPGGKQGEVELHALRPGNPMRSIPGRGLDGAQPCE